MVNALDRLRAARFEGEQALYTTAVRLLSERLAMPDDLAGLVDAAVEAADKYLMVRTNLDVKHVVNVKCEIRDAILAAIPVSPTPVGDSGAGETDSKGGKK